MVEKLRVILIVLGMIVSTMVTIASGGLAIYFTAWARFNPGLYRNYSAYIGFFNLFAPILGYLLELAGVLSIAFWKRTESGP